MLLSDYLLLFFVFIPFIIAFAVGWGVCYRLELRKTELIEEREKAATEFYRFAIAEMKGLAGD